MLARLLSLALFVFVIITSRSHSLTHSLAPAPRYAPHALRISYLDLL